MFGTPSIYQSDDPAVLREHLDVILQKVDQSRDVFDKVALEAKLGDSLDVSAAHCLTVSPSLKDTIGNFLLSLDSPQSRTCENPEAPRSKQTFETVVNEDAKGPGYRERWFAAWGTAEAASKIPRIG